MLSATNVIFAVRLLPDSHTDCRDQTRLFSAPFGLWKQ